LVQLPKIDPQAKQGKHLRDRQHAKNYVEVASFVARYGF
jgi:hypothetical protein